MPKIVTDKEVFDAVLNVLLESGYAGSTTKQIAELANVNEATLFRKYGSKEKLVNRAIQHKIETADISSVMYYTGDIREDLLRVVTKFFHQKDKDQLFFVLISEIRRSPELAATINAPLDVMMKFGQLLARYQSEGVLRQEHPFHALAALAGPLVMNRMMKSSNPNFPLPEPDLAMHVEQYLTGREITESYTK